MLLYSLTLASMVLNIGWCMLLCSLACLAERSNSCVMWCRRLCVSAGHVDPWHLLAPDQQIPAEGHRDEDEDKENNSRMTFGKFVNSFFFYCDNPSKFAEKRLDRDRHMSELRQCLREVIRDEVSCASQPTVGCPAEKLATELKYNAKQKQVDTGNAQGSELCAVYSRLYLNIIWNLDDTTVHTNSMPRCLCAKPQAATHHPCIT